MSCPVVLKCNAVHKVHRENENVEEQLQLKCEMLVLETVVKITTFDWTLKTDHHKS